MKRSKHKGKVDQSKTKPESNRLDPQTAYSTPWWFGFWRPERNTKHPNLPTGRTGHIYWRLNSGLKIHIRIYYILPEPKRKTQIKCLSWDMRPMDSIWITHTQLMIAKKAWKHVIAIQRGSEKNILAVSPPKIHPLTHLSTVQPVLSMFVNYPGQSDHKYKQNTQT